MGSVRGLDIFLPRGLALSYGVISWTSPSTPTVNFISFLSLTHCYHSNLLPRPSLRPSEPDIMQSSKKRDASPNATTSVRRTRAKAAVEASRTSVMHVTFQDYAVLPDMTAMSLDEFLPQSLLIHLQGAEVSFLSLSSMFYPALTIQTRAQWDSISHIFVAHLFYRQRAFADDTIKTILQSMQPSQASVVNALSEFAFVKGMITNIQDDIVASHRFLADVFLGSEIGTQWVARLKKTP